MIQVKAAGVVLHTIVDKELRAQLEQGCRDLDMPCVAALDPLIASLARYLGASISTRVGQHIRPRLWLLPCMDALAYAIGHDDGQGTQDLEGADVVLVGVSRTSKTPTSIYLAHRGVRAANVPLVPSDRARRSSSSSSGQRCGRLDVVIEDRLRSISVATASPTFPWTRESTCVDIELCGPGIFSARQLFEKHGWPDHRNSRAGPVEETAAAVINVMTAGGGQVEVLT